VARVLLVDDERKIGVVLSGELEDKGHQVLMVQDGRTAVQLIKEQSFEIVVSDIRMEPMDGLEVLAEVRQATPEADVIMMTAYASTDTAIEALRHGAADYLVKPFPAEELVHVIDRVLERQRLALENSQLKTELASASDDMIAESDAMKRISKLVERVAAAEATVLITGASGTGKEVVAQAIHRHSARSAGPFVPVNCAALPESLLESELFGHEKGAFTGADRRKLGRFEIAGCGTIFLDEIGEIGQSVQAKLLRVIEARSFERVGGTTGIDADVRIIAATNMDLDAAVADGRFREDLFYRLNVFPLELPPLVDRPEDIEALAQHFISTTRLSLSDESLELLRGYGWPGNVRELRNVLERAVILSDGDVIEPDHLLLRPVRPDSTSHAEPQRIVDVNLERNERRLIAEALERAQGNKTEAAKLLGISRRALYSRAGSLGVELN
jgi:DNA-binding NtrC family response regulator